MPNPALYLCHFRFGAADTDAVAAQFGGVPLAPGLFLTRTDAARSRLYHALKRALPKDAPLLVAPLSGDPKFKGMAPGALSWLRAGPDAA